MNYRFLKLSSFIIKSSIDSYGSVSNNTHCLQICSGLFFAIPTIVSVGLILLKTKMVTSNTLVVFIL